MSKSSFWKNNLVLIQGITLILVLTPLLRFYFLNQPLIYILPNLLLFTSFRQYTRTLWLENVVIDKRIKLSPTHIPEISASDYSFEVIKEATENWRYPAVVRGLFKDTPAVTKWLDPIYLTKKIGEYKIPVVKKAIYGTMQNDREVMTFNVSYNEIMSNLDSKWYLFFPVKSRFNFNGSEAGSLDKLQDAVNEVVLEDLQIDKLIWNGFGTKKHSTYFGSQLIIGRGSNDSADTTGTGWHCAAGNNWFIQVISISQYLKQYHLEFTTFKVAGRKRWYFMDTQYSALMYPLRGGKVNMMTGNAEMGKLHDHLPLRYVDLEAGDLLYNPDWEWHTIKNYDGLSIGVPIREVNLTLSFRNNFLYTSVVLVNKVSSALGFDIGGYPPNN